MVDTHARCFTATEQQLLQSSYDSKQFLKCSENLKKQSANKFIKTRTIQRIFSCEIPENFQTSFSTKLRGWLLLNGSRRLLLTQSNFSQLKILSAGILLEMLMYEKSNTDSP